MNFERKRQPEDNGNEVDTWSNNYCLANSTSFTTLLNRRSPLSPFPSDALLYFGLIFIPTMLIYLTWEYKRLVNLWKLITLAVAERNSFCSKFICAIFNYKFYSILLFNRDFSNFNC